MRQWVSLVATCVLAVSALQASSAAAAGLNNDAKMKVVVQVSDDDPRKWQMALSNVKNIQRDLGADHVEIEVVAFGPGIAMLKANAVTAARVTEAKADGIVLNACQNTMAGMKLTPEDMNPVVTYVPSGAGEVVKKQYAGYAYLRP